VNTCGTCKAWGGAGDDSSSDCHLHPPIQFVSVQFPLLPTVGRNDWCLDWVSKEKAQAVPRGANGRKTVYPADFVPSDRAEAMAKAQGQNIHAMVAEWRDHHKAKGSLMADWQASLMTWLRNDVKFKEKRR